MCVDGLQRITVAQRFIHNEIKVFDSYYEEFQDSIRLLDACMFLNVNDLKFEKEVLNVNDLKFEKEVLQWYIDMNAGGTPHTAEEIFRVKKLIDKL